MSAVASNVAPYPSRAASTSSTSQQPSLSERIRALDRSSELSQHYIALVLFHPKQSTYVTVGHAERSFITSALLNCKDEEGNPIFVRVKLLNINGDMVEVLKLQMDTTLESTINNGGEFNHKELFKKRTSAFENVTNHLLSSGVISRKHSDLYPISPFTKSSKICTNNGSENGKKVVLAHVNRNTAPYIGIDSVGVHLHCYVGQQDKDRCINVLHESDKSTTIKGVWLAKRAPNKSHHPNYWDPTVAGGQPANLSILDNIVKEAHEEAGVPAEWIQNKSPNASHAKNTVLSDHTHDPLTITTAKPDGSCMKRSLYYSCDLQVPYDWTPTPVDGEVSEFKLYSMMELEEELRFGNSVRPAMRAVLLDFMMRHGALAGGDDLDELRDAMRRERLVL